MDCLKAKALTLTLSQRERGLRWDCARKVDNEKKTTDQFVQYYGITSHFVRRRCRGRAIFLILLIDLLKFIVVAIIDRNIFLCNRNVAPTQKNIYRTQVLN